MFLEWVDKHNAHESKLEAVRAALVEQGLSTTLLSSGMAGRPTKPRASEYVETLRAVEVELTEFES